MGISKLTINLAFVTLFAMAIFTFAISFGNDNGTTVNVGDDPRFTDSQNNLNDGVVTYYDSVNTSLEAFHSTTVSSLTDTSEGGTQFKSTGTPSLSQFKNAITTSFATIFGGSSAFSVLFSVLLGVLGFVMGVYFWVAWKGGQV